MRSFVGVRAHLALAAVPLMCCVGWLVWHLVELITVFSTIGDSLVFSWLASFLLLWWIPMAWWERPLRAPSGCRGQLDRLVVTVQIPVYNEDEQALRACLRSVLTQSRKVNRIRVVDDGSTDRVSGTPISYAEVRKEFLAEAAARGIEATWDRIPNRGKRWAQMHVLATDDADIFVTMDSDSVLDRHAVREGLKPFHDPKVRSVAGHVCVLNNRTNLLTQMTTILYLQFTRGLRSALSVLRRVTINSGTLAFYRADVVRKYAGSYENERFGGRPMQMNDDSLLTFYGLLEGDTVHQPSAIVFTLVPERLPHYLRQQLRWMRGTTVRHFWWLRYMPVTGLVFWATVGEYLHVVLSMLIPVVLVTRTPSERVPEVLLYTLLVAVIMQYLMALRLFVVRRDDDRFWFTALLYVLSPITALWRLIVLRPMYLYGMLTCYRINAWGTRGTVEVRAAEAPS